MNANILRALCFLALLSALPAHAADRVVHDYACGDKVLPNLQAFARAAGIANAGQAYEVRRKAQFQFLQACHRGFDHVRLVRRDVVGTEPTWVVKR